MMFIRAALHVALSLHRFRSSISKINQARWGSVGVVGINLFLLTQNRFELSNIFVGMILCDLFYIFSAF